MVFGGIRRSTIGRWDRGFSAIAGYKLVEFARAAVFARKVATEGDTTEDRLRLNSNQ